MLLGRHADLERLALLIEAGERCVTLFGPAGVGKTTLLRAFVEQLSRRTADPIISLELHTGDDTRSLFAALASALSLYGGPAQWALGLAAQGPLVVAIDGLERLSGSARELFAEWLESAPELQLVIASREKIGLPAELLHEVGPLSLRTRGTKPSEAMELWLSSVRKNQPDYAPSAEELAQIEALLAKLEGLPLAIELAAAQRAESGLIERPVSTGPLSAALETSWIRLSEPARRALAQASIFRGPFDLEAAEVVLDPGEGVGAREAITVLVDSSLVRRDRADRYLLFDAVRGFAAEKLELYGDRTELEERHAHHAMRRAEHLLALFAREGGRAALLELEENHSGLLAAAETDLSANRTSRALRILVALGATRAGEYDPEHLRVLLARALAAPVPKISASVLASAHELAGRLWSRAGEHARAEGEVQRAFELASHEHLPLLAAKFLRSLAKVQLRRGQVHHAHSTGLRALQLAQQIGARVLEGMALELIGRIERRRGRVAEAHRAYEAALAVHRELGQPFFEGSAGVKLAVLMLECGRLEDARTQLERVEAVPEQTRSRSLQASLDGTLGALLYFEDRLELSLRHSTRAVEIFRRLGDERIAAIMLAFTGLAQLERGELSEARAAFAEALPVLRSSGEDDFSEVFGAAHAASEALAGDAQLASAMIDALEERVATWASPTRLAAVKAMRVFVSARTVSPNELTAQLQHIRAALAPHAELSQQRDGDRSVAPLVALRLLDRLLNPAFLARPPEKRRLLLHERGRWFVAPNGERVSCEKRPAARRILMALARQQERSPGATLSAKQLLSAGWPNEKILPAAAKNRLHVTLSRLRDLGLRSALLAEGDGWLLDPAVELEYALD